MPSSLDRIFASVGQTSSTPTPSSSSGPNTDDDPVVKELSNGYKKLASGIVLDPSGKPCRQCTSVSAWMAMAKRGAPASASANSSSNKSTISSAVASSTIASFNSTESTTDPGNACPPDVDELGRSTWTLLHTLAAGYPTTASSSMQATTRQFISTFSQLYPCGYCAEDFRDWMKEPGNEARVEGQDAFGDWACRAHNAVNVKLGKREFDCGLWKQRWKDGWDDGRCG